MTDEMKEALKEYLKDNLSVQVDIGYYSWSGRQIKVSLSLDGEEFSTTTEELPEAN